MLVRWVCVCLLLWMAAASNCINNVCRLPTSCEDIATYCGACPKIESQPGLNYNDCAIVITGITNVSLTDDGIYSQLTITNCQNVLISGTQQIQQLTVQYTQDLTLDRTTLNVSGQVFFNGTQAISLLTIFDSVINATQLGMLTMGAVNINNSIVNTSMNYCTELWPYSQIMMPQPFLAFNYADLQFTASTNFTPTSNFSALIPYFSMGILSNQAVSITNSDVVTSTLIVVSSDLTVDTQSTIDASSMGCQSNLGAGRGLNITSSEMCNNSGASSAGYGGYGTNSTTCQESIQFFQFILHSFPYGFSENPAVSGSAGSNPNGQCLSQSAGGGIIVLQVAGSANINGVVDVSGGAATSAQCSAGSAGSINVFAGSILGNGSFVAQGGNSNNNNGEGSGGYIKLLSFNSIFNGTINIKSGQNSFPSNFSADSGSVFYQNCPPGQGPSPFTNSISTECFPCPPYFYKTPLNLECVSCPDVYGLEINDSSHNNSMSSQCYKSKMLQPSMLGLNDVVRRITFTQIMICFGLIMLFAIIGVILRRLYKRKKSRLETQSFDFQKATQDINNSKIITEGLKSQREFKMADLMYHVHRISVFGSNIYDNPWILSQNPPQQLHSLIIAETYEQFARNLNSLMQWRIWQRNVLYLSFIVYPLYWYLLILFKKQKYRRVVKFVETTKLNFINKDVGESRSLIKIKVSKNTDYTICYLDVFSYHRADLKYFMLSCPYLVYLSGEGNFIRPFYLCQTDPFLNVLYFIVNRNIEKGYEEVNERYRLMGNLVNQKKRLENSSQLSRFVRHFNRASCTLDLDSPVQNFIHGVTILVDLLNLWNHEFFNRFSVQINLLLITSKFEGNRIVDHEISILERSDVKRFDEFMTKALEDLRQYSKYDIKFAIFIYNPNQDMEEFNRAKHKDTLSAIDGELSHKPSMKDSLDDSLLEKEKRSGQCLQKCNRALGFIRYNFISHRTSSTSKYVLEFFQIVLVLFDATFIAVWQSWLTYPYVGVDFIAPFVGVIWITSGNSYGVGKIFLVLNAMAFFNDCVEIIWMLAKWPDSNWLYKLLRVIAFVLQFGIIAVGCRMITYSKKLNQPKIS